MWLEIVMVDYSRGVANRGIVWRNVLDHEKVVGVHYNLIVLLYNMVDLGDSFVDKEVQGEVELFVGNAGMGE